MAATQLNVSDVHIERLIIESASGKYDLVPHLDELNIYEDIFSNSVKGDITLNDAYNLPYKLPIVGEETIDCKIRMTGDSGSDEPFRFLDPPKFYIYELSDRYSLEDPESGFGPIKAQRYSLNFVSEQFMSNHHSRVSKAYTNMTADEIVGDIWSNYLDDGKGDLIVTDAIRGEYCIIPNWHPHEAFNWLASRAQAEKKSAVINYVYYETIDSSNFVSLESLTKAEAVLSFVKDARVFDPTKIEGLTDFYVRVDDIMFLNNNNKLKNISRGQYSSKLITHDILTKQIAQHEYDGLENFTTYDHLSGWPQIPYSRTTAQVGNTFRTSFAPPPPNKGIISEGSSLEHFTDSAVSFYPKHTNMYGAASSETDDSRVEDWKLQHAGQISLYDGITLQIQCSGITALRVGQTVNVFVLSPETTSQGKFDVATDKYMSGKYMITAIRHIIKHNKHLEYKMFIEVTKDSLDELPTPRGIAK